MSAQPDPSLLASLRVVESVLRVSSATVLDVLLDRLTPEQSEARLAWWSRHVMEVTGIDLRSKGREHLLGGETFVIMSNHQSHLDVPCLYRALSPKMRMVAKKELFRFPLFGSAMRQTGFVEVDRGDRKRAIQSLHGARSLLDQGYHVWIAPEGTRSKTGQLLPFKKGGFMLALESDARILPVGIHGTREVLPVGAMRARTGRPVGLVVGAPIDTRGVERDALMATTRSAIEALTAEARALCGLGPALRRPRLLARRRLPWPRPCLTLARPRSPSLAAGHPPPPTPGRPSAGDERPGALAGRAAGAPHARGPNPLHSLSGLEG